MRLSRFIPFASLLLFVLFTTKLNAQQELQAMTFNIRYDNPDDPLPWDERRDEVAQVISFNDIIGVQEALHHQVLDLEERLPLHGWFGVGRDDGRRAGEFAPVFWNRNKFRFIHGETLWLSAWPRSIGSTGWDAHMPRIVTVVLLQHLESGKTIRVLNAHFSHVGKNARMMAAQLLRGYAVSARQDEVLVMGDFNSAPGSAAYQVLSKTPFRDTYNSADVRCRRSFSTYTTFRPEDTTGRRIDHIFSSLDSVEWVCIEEQIKNGFYISDHLPMFIVFTL